MPRIKVGEEGYVVEVDDNFKNLPPEQQNATVKEIYDTIRAAQRPTQIAQPAPLERAETDPMAMALGEQYGAAPANLAGIGKAVYKLVGETAKRAIEHPEDPRAALSGATLGLPMSPAVMAGLVEAKLGVPVLRKAFRTPAEAKMAEQLGELGLPTTVPTMFGTKPATITPEAVKAVGEAAATRPLVENLRPPPFTPGRAKWEPPADLEPTSVGVAGAALRSRHATNYRKVDPEDIHPAVRAVIATEGRFPVMRNEQVVQSVINKAGTGAGADLSGLRALKSGVPTGEWRQMQSAVLDSMGRKGGEWNPTAFVKDVNALSEGGRGVIFGPASAPTRRFVDALADVSTAVMTKAGEKPPALLTLLKFVPKGQLISRLLRLEPKYVAPVRRWGLAYKEFMTAWPTLGPGMVAADVIASDPRAAGAAAAFKRATRELGKNLGIELDPEELVRAASEGRM